MKRLNLALLSISTAFLASCVTVKTSALIDREMELERLERGQTYVVVSRGKLVGFRGTEAAIREMGTTGVSYESGETQAERLQRFLVDAITERLGEAGFIQGTAEANAELKVIFDLNYRFESDQIKRDSFVGLRIKVIEQATGEVVFNRAGRFEVNEQLNRPVAEEIVARILEPIAPRIER